MAGYPNYITRTSLGPTYVNVNKVANPTQEIDANVFNLLCWQVAGVNGCVPRGLVIGLDDGLGNLSVLRKWYAWDPSNTAPDVVFSTIGTGNWSWTIPGGGSAVDMNGQSYPIGLIAAEASPNGTSARFMIAEVDADGDSGSLRCMFTSTAALTNIGGPGVPKKFILKLY